MFLYFKKNTIDIIFLFRSKAKNEYLKNLARDNTQILLNALWDLPTERVENCIVAKLPKCTYITPREKPIPKPKPLTKWQEYAKEKGIKNKKKSNVTWDEVLKVFISYLRINYY